MDRQCVLAIECDWRIRKLIRANLEVLGLRVREAVSGAHGLHLFDECQPDLILLDMDLPDMDARCLIDAFDGLFGDHPVPVVAMCTEPPDRRLLQQVHVVGFLQKPFSVAILLQEVRRALESTPTDP